MFGSHAIISEDEGRSSCLECATEFESDEALDNSPRCPGLQEIGPCVTEDGENSGHILEWNGKSEELDCLACGAHNVTSLEGVDSDDYVAFANGYAHALLWADTRDGGEDVNPYDWHTPAADWAIDAFDAKSRELIDTDCRGFLSSMVSDVREYVDTMAARPGTFLDRRAAFGTAGHDFLLTRNRHGAGYWDRGLGELGERLTAAAHPYGSTSAEVSDDIASIVEG